MSTQKNTLKTVTAVALSFCLSSLSTSSTVDSCLSEGTAAASRSAKMRPTSRKGRKVVPHKAGPKGANHAPPAQDARKMTRKKRTRLDQGPLVWKIAKKRPSIGRQRTVHKSNE